MKRFGLKDLWKVTAGQAGGAAATTDTNISQSSPSSRPNHRPDPADLTLSVITSLPGPPQGRVDAQVSDGDKTGATLLFSGIFLALVGMTFTAMGWINYDVSLAFEWTQLLGPILLSVGGTFVLISVCKFRMLSCQACRQREDGGRAEDAEVAHSQSFVFTGINQPITFHRATVVQYIPPPYASVTQEQQVSVSSPPLYCSVCPLESPALVSSDCLAPSALSSRRESRYLPPLSPQTYIPQQIYLPGAIGAPLI